MTFEVGTMQKRKNDLTRQAVAMAMANRWAEAVKLNRSILDDFPNDLETYNRLGKALSELGRNREARQAFERALSLSPHNPIAKKNLDRLSKLGDEARGAAAPVVRPRRAFIEERGKSGVTSLMNLAPAERLLELAPGHPLNLDMVGGALKVSSQSGEHLGQVEPRLAARLVRLTKGGNRYEAVVTGVEERSLAVFIRETFRHPSQAGTVSFPSSERSAIQVLALSAPMRRETVGSAGVKDWSDDDTEPGDDEIFDSTAHRIIDPAEEIETEL